MTCFNRNTAQWKAINAKYTNPIVVDSIMTKWQETNGTDVLPTLQDVEVYLKQKKQMLSVDQTAYKNTLLNNFLERNLIDRAGDMYVIKSAEGLKQIYRLMKVWNVPSASYNVNTMGLISVLEIDASKFNKSNMILSRTEDAHVLDVIDHMLKMFPQLNLDVVSRDEAKQYYNNLSEEQKQLSYGASFFNVKAYYVDNTVKIVKGSVSPETVAEEILHPFVNTMEVENNALYKGLLSEAKQIYPNLLEQTQEVYKDYTQENLDKEFLTKALSNNFNKQFELQPTTSWKQKIMDVLNFIGKVVKDLYKYISGSSISISDIKSTSTISDVTKLLNTKDLKFNLNSDLIKNTAVQFELTDDRKGLVNQINEEATDEQKDIVDRLTYASKESKKNVESFTVSDYLKELADPIIINVDNKYYNIDNVNDVRESIMDKLKVAQDPNVKVVDLKIEDVNTVLEAIVLKKGFEGIEKYKIKTFPTHGKYIEQLYNTLKARVEGLQEVGAVLLPKVVVADPKSNVASTISLLAIEENGTITPINITYNRPQDSTKLIQLEKDGVLSKLFPNGITRTMLNAITNNTQARILQNLGYTVSDTSKSINITFDDSQTSKVSMSTPYKISDAIDYVDLIVPELAVERTVEDVSNELNELAQQQDEMDIDPYEAVGKKLNEEEVQKGLATNKLRRQTLETYRSDLLNRQQQIRAFNSQKVLNDDGTVAARQLSYIDKHLSLIANGLDSGAFDITYEKMLKDTSEELVRIKKYLSDPQKINQYKKYLNAVEMFSDFAESYRSLADASEDLKELDIDRKDLKFSDSERSLQDQVRRQLDELVGRGGNKTSLLLNARKNAIKLYIMNNSSSPFYNKKSDQFDEEALNDVLNFIKDQTMSDQWLGTVASSESPLLSLADQLFKSTKINGMNQVEKRIEEEVRPLLIKLERLQSAKNIIGQKRIAKDFFHYMYEFDQNGDFTGMTVQKTDYKNYQAVWERETKDTKDALGEPLEYIIKDPNLLTQKDKDFNIKLHQAKIRQAKFYAPESIEKIDGVYIYKDGDYHMYTPEYKKARAEIVYFNTGTGQWQKKSDVSRYKYQKWKNKWKEKPDKDYQKMEYDFAGGGPTGVVEIMTPRTYDRKLVDGKLTRVPRPVSSKGDNLQNSKYKAIMEADPNNELAVAKKEFYLLYQNLMEEYLDMLPASVKQSFNGKSPLIFNKFFNNVSNEGNAFLRLYEKMAGFKMNKISKGRLNPLKPTMAASSAFNKVAGVYIETPPIMYVGSAKNDNAIDKLYELKDELLKDSTTIDPKTGKTKISAKEYQEKAEEIDQRIMLLESQPTKNEMSLNAGSNLIDFMTMANHYDNMNQIKGFLNGIKDILDNAMYEPGGLMGGKGRAGNLAGIIPTYATEALYVNPTPGSVSTEKLATIPGEDAKLPQRYKTWLKNTFYRNIGKGQAEARGVKVLDKFKFFTSFLYVGTNTFANFGNFIQGTTATWREAAGQNWVTAGSIARATKEYYTTALPGIFAKLGHKSSYSWLTGAGQFDKIKAPNEYWARADYWRMMDSAAEIAEIGRQRAQGAGVMESFANMAFVINNGVEYKVQTIMGTAYLDTQKMQVRDKDGNVLEEKSLKDIAIFDSQTGEYKLDIAAEGGKFTHYMDTRNRTLELTETGDQRIAVPVKTKAQFEKFFGKIRNDIREFNIQAHGNYAYDDKTYIQSNFLGELAMQFGKWVAPLGRAAYTPLYFDENLGWIEGRQRALGNVYAQLRKFTAKAAFDAQNPEISLVRRRNAMKTLFDYLVIAVSLAMANWMLGGDNPYDKGTFMRRFRYFARYSFEKLAKEVLFFTPWGIEQPLTMKSTDPFPLVRVIKEAFDVASTLHHIPYIGYADWLDDDLYKKLKRNKKYFYQRGSKRGTPKYQKEIRDIFPFMYTKQRWEGFDDQQEHYKKY